MVVSISAVYPCELVADGTAASPATQYHDTAYCMVEKRWKFKIWSVVSPETKPIDSWFFFFFFFFLVVRYANPKSSFSFSDGSFFIAPYCVFLFYTVSPPNSLRILIVVILKFPLLCIYFCFLWSPLMFLFSLCFSFWRFSSNGYWSLITIDW